MPRLLLILPFAVVALAVVTGVRTEMIENPWFSRMTPVRTADTSTPDPLPI